MLLLRLGGIVVFVIGALVGGFLTSSWKSEENSNLTLSTNRESTNATNTVHTNSKVNTHTNRELFSSDLMDLATDAESVFQSTMRSCLGKGCFDDPVDTGGGMHTNRVAVLMPFRDGSEPLVHMILKASGGNMKKIDIIFDTNVPPYGYGKNHGWSRIIRVASNVVPTSIALLKHRYAADEKKILELIEPQVQQLMRWHCRLSHVAAHTAMLTVHIEDVLRRPVEELDRMLTFSGKKTARGELLNAVQAFHPPLAKAWAKLVGVTSAQNAGPSSNAPEAKAEASIRAEMIKSKDLTKWPCASFRDYAHPDIASALPIPPIELAANCSERYTKCTIRYDIEEHKRIHS